LFALASAESRSEHPLARPAVERAREAGIATVEPAKFEALPGFGVQAQVDSRTILAGNSKLLAKHGVPTEALAAQAEALEKNGQTVIFVAANGHPLGLVGLSDELKPDARRAVQDLDAVGLKVVMLSGDTEVAAQAVAHQLGISEVLAQVSPQAKAETIRRLRERRVVAMVGDGINDAPALAEADLGIALGTGTDVAMEAAEVALISGDVAGVPVAISLGRRVLRTIYQNLFLAFVYNVLMIPLAAGVLYPSTGMVQSPIFAAAAMAASSVSVVSNALRLGRFRPPHPHSHQAQAHSH